MIAKRTISYVVAIIMAFGLILSFLPARTVKAADTVMILNPDNSTLYCGGVPYTGNIVLGSDSDQLRPVPNEPEKYYLMYGTISKDLGEGGSTNEVTLKKQKDNKNADVIAIPRRQDDPSWGYWQAFVLEAGEAYIPEWDVYPGPKVTIDFNGGESSIAPVQKTSKTDYAPEVWTCELQQYAQDVHRDGYTLNGWTYKDGSAVKFKMGQAVRSGGPNGPNPPGYFSYFEVTEDVTIVANWIEGEFENTVSEEPLEEVPDGVVTQFDSVGQIEVLLKNAAIQNSDLNENSNTWLLDVVCKLNGVPMTPEEMPESGITVLLPYPKGADKTKDVFEISHMMTLGEKAGQTEVLKGTPKEDGIEVTLTSFSPVLIAYGDTTEVAPAEEETASEVPLTADSNMIFLWITLFLIAGLSIMAACVVRKK